MMNFNQENFESEVIQSPDIAIAVFWAAWCGHCMDYLEMVGKIANNAGIKAGKVNADENQDLARQYDIKVIPTLLVFKNGKVINSIYGRREEEELKKLILNGGP
jgi:thioredoxin 1